MEGPTYFRSKFADCCGALSVANQLKFRELKNEFTSAGEPFQPLRGIDCKRSGQAIWLR